MKEALVKDAGPLAGSKWNTEDDASSKQRESELKEGLLKKKLVGRAGPAISIKGAAGATELDE